MEGMETAFFWWKGKAFSLCGLQIRVIKVSWALEMEFAQHKKFSLLSAQFQDQKQQDIIVKPQEK